MEAIVCHSELYSIPFYPYIFIQQALSTSKPSVYLHNHHF